ncbi:hypothetical protein Tcan_01790, partial [Toxocara canis]
MTLYRQNIFSYNKAVESARKTCSTVSEMRFSTACSIFEEHTSVDGAVFRTYTPFAGLARRSLWSFLSWLSICPILPIRTLLAGWSLRSWFSIQSRFSWRSRHSRWSHITLKAWLSRFKRFIGSIFSWWSIGSFWSRLSWSTSWPFRSWFSWWPIHSGTSGRPFWSLISLWSWWTRRARWPLRAWLTWRRSNGLTRLARRPSRIARHAGCSWFSRLTGPSWWSFRAWRSWQAASFTHICLACGSIATWDRVMLQQLNAFPSLFRRLLQKGDLRSHLLSYVVHIVVYHGQCYTHRQNSNKREGNSRIGDKSIRLNTTVYVHGC